MIRKKLTQCLQNVAEKNVYLNAIVSHMPEKDLLRQAELSDERWSAG